MILIHNEERVSKHDVYINNVLIRKYSFITTMCTTVKRGGGASGRRNGS